MIRFNQMMMLTAAWLASAGLATAAVSASKSAPHPAPKAASQSSAKSSQKAPPQEMALGNPKAPVTVIEYASLSCPHCARFNNDVFPAFKKKYVDTGKVRYVFREFLTEPVNVATAAVLVARCAGPDKYFSVIDDFFRGQAEAYQKGDVGPLLRSVAAKGGLDEAKLVACLSDKAANEALVARVERWSTKEGVDSTPTIVINGKKLGPLDHEIVLEDLDAAIAPLLAGKGR